MTSIEFSFSALQCFKNPPAVFPISRRIFVLPFHFLTDHLLTSLHFLTSSQQISFWEFQLGISSDTKYSAGGRFFSVILASQLSCGVIQ